MDSTLQNIDLDDSISFQNHSFLSTSDRSTKLEEQLRKSNESVLKLRTAYSQLKNSYLQKNRQIEELKELLNAQLEEKPKTIQQIIACVKVDSVDWILVKIDQDLEWQRKKDLEISVETVDYNKEAEAQRNHVQKKDTFQEELQLVIKQYESRNVKIQSLYQENELKISDLQDKNKQLHNQIQSNQEKLNKIVDESETILQNCLQVNYQNQFLNEENDKSTKNECLTKMKFLLNNLEETQLDEQYNVFKDHILIMHQTVHDIMKKLNLAEQDQIQIEKSFRDKIDLLTIEKQKEHKQSNFIKIEMEVLDQGRKRVKELEQQIEETTYQNNRTIKEQNIKIEFLQQEMKKNVNTQYIKNILMKFFESDYNVQERTINVIGTVLQFSNEELMEFTKNWQNSTKIQSSFYSVGKVNLIKQVFQKWCQPTQALTHDCILFINPQNLFSSCFNRKISF